MISPYLIDQLRARQILFGLPVVVIRWPAFPHDEEFPLSVTINASIQHFLDFVLATTSVALCSFAVAIVRVVVVSLIIGISIALAFLGRFNFLWGFFLESADKIGAAQSFLGFPSIIRRIITLPSDQVLSFALESLAVNNRLNLILIVGLLCLDFRFKLGLFSLEDGFIYIIVIWLQEFIAAESVLRLPRVVFRAVVFPTNTVENCSLQLTVIDNFWNLSWKSLRLIKFRRFWIPQC